MANYNSLMHRVVFRGARLLIVWICVGVELRLARHAGHARFGPGAHRRVAESHAGLATLASMM